LELLGESGEQGIAAVHPQGAWAARRRRRHYPVAGFRWTAALRVVQA
jgi:hypothetical protein